MVRCQQKIALQNAKGFFKVKMEIETESKQTSEPILNVGNKNIKESELRSEQLRHQRVIAKAFYHKTMQLHKIYITLMCRLLQRKFGQTNSEFAEGIHKIDGVLVTHLVCWLNIMVCRSACTLLTL